MAGALIRDVRRAVLIRLKADAAVTAIVPAARIYPAETPAEPAFPFTRFDAPQSIPLDMACVAGATVTFLKHGFAKARYQGGAMIETAEDHAQRLGDALWGSLHNHRLPLAGLDGATVLIRVQSLRIVRDGDDPDAQHAILSCSGRVLAS